MERTPNEIAARLLARRYLPFEHRDKWPAYMATTACAALALGIACIRLKKAVLKELGVK